MNKLLLVHWAYCLPYRWKPHLSKCHLPTRHRLMSRRLIMREVRVGDVVGEMTTEVGGATIAGIGVRSAGAADTRAGKHGGTVTAVSATDAVTTTTAIITASAATVKTAGPLSCSSSLTHSRVVGLLANPSYAGTYPALFSAGWRM